MKTPEDHSMVLIISYRFSSVWRYPFRFTLNVCLLSLSLLLLLDGSISSVTPASVGAFSELGWPGSALAKLWKTCWPCPRTPQLYLLVQIATVPFCVGHLCTHFALMPHRQRLGNASSCSLEFFRAHAIWNLDQIYSPIPFFWKTTNLQNQQSYRRKKLTIEACGGWARGCPKPPQTQPVPSKSL